MKICNIDGCRKKYLANGYCIRHYMQIRRHGRILGRTYRDPNEFINYGDYYEIILYKNVKDTIECARTKVDSEYIETAKKYKWRKMSTGYAGTNLNGTAFLLHHLIMGLPSKGKEIDHINGNRLDNRMENLRFATRNQNNWNRKGTKGYTWNKLKNRWQSQICVNYKHIVLGYFKNKEDAINARRKAEQKYFGEFAPQR